MFLAKGANTENPVIRRLQFICLVIQYGVTISRIFETELGPPFYVAEQALKQVDSNDIGASHLTVPIPDPEKEAALIEQEENLVPEGFEAGDPEKWFVDTQGEATIEPSGPPRTWLQDDFVPFEEEDSSSDESFESFSSIIV